MINFAGFLKLKKMKEPIIEIEELGRLSSIIYRKDAQTSEIVDTQEMLKELNEQLNIAGRREQLSCETCKFYPADYDPFCATCKNFEKHVKAT